MKPHFNRLLLSALIFGSTALLQSCQKEKLSNLTSAQNSALADESFNDVNNIADEAATTGAVSGKMEDANSLLAGCATVTVDTLAFPHLATVDFGSGCTGPDGKTRSGKILISFDGRYRDPGTTITITFDNFFVNGNQLLGSKVVHNEGPNAAGNLHFSVNVNGSMVLASNGGTVTWTSQRDREWLAGSSTQTRDDDQYSLTGSGSGVAANGDNFSATIVEPLIRNLAPGCRRHFTAGVVQISRDNRPDKTIDFGSGACDDQAVVTVNGQSHTITLH